MLLAWLCFTKSHSLLPLRPQQKKKWAFVWIICYLWPSHVWWWNITERSAWSRVFLTLAQSEDVPHLQRRHSTGAPRLCPDTFLYTGSSLWFPQTSHIYRCCCHSSGFADVDCQILKVNKTDGKEWSQSKVFRSWCSSLVCLLSISTAFEKVIHTALKAALQKFWHS